MTTKRLGLIMNGVTGRMGLNQHLIRSIIAIRDQGGVVLANGDRMLPDPILIGRDADKVERLARRFNVERWSTDLEKALADKADTIFFRPGRNSLSCTVPCLRPLALASFTTATASSRLVAIGFSQ